MPYETLIVVFDQPDQASAAIRGLRKLGIPASDIKRHPTDAATAADVAPAGVAYPEQGFWAWLFSRDVNEKEQAALQRALHKGGTVISVSVMSEEVTSIRSELDRYGPSAVEQPASEEDP